MIWIKKITRDITIGKFAIYILVTVVAVSIIIKNFSIIYYIVNGISKSTGVDIHFINELLYKIQIDRGSFASIFGISIAYILAYKQLRKRAVNSKDEAIRNHMIAVSEFACCNGSTEGIYYEDTKRHKYIAMWRLARNSKPNNREYILVIIFRICSHKSKISDELMRGDIENWWDHKLIIPRYGSNHGVVIESYNEKRTYDFISGISNNDRINIMRAMKSIQILDKKGISDCKDMLSDSFLSEVSGESLIKLEDESLATEH